MKRKTVLEISKSGRSERLAKKAATTSIEIKELNRPITEFMEATGSKVAFEKILKSIKIENDEGPATASEDSNRPIPKLTEAAGSKVAFEKKTLMSLKNEQSPKVTINAVSDYSGQALGERKRKHHIQNSAQMKRKPLDIDPSKLRRSERLAKKAATTSIEIKELNRPNPEFTEATERKVAFKKTLKSIKIKKNYEGPATAPIPELTEATESKVAFEKILKSIKIENDEGPATAPIPELTEATESKVAFEKILKSIKIENDEGPATASENSNRPIPELTEATGSKVAFEKILKSLKNDQIIAVSDYPGQALGGTKRKQYLYCNKELKFLRAETESYVEAWRKDKFGNFKSGIW